MISKSFLTLIKNLLFLLFFLSSFAIFCESYKFSIEGSSNGKDWVMFRYDLSNSGYLSYSKSNDAINKISIDKIELRNIYESKGVLSTPVVSDINNDGKKEIVVGSEDGILYALKNTLDGELWHYKTSGRITTSPVIDDINNDGKKEIVVGSEDGILYALNSNGKLLWKFKSSGRIKSSPKIFKLKEKRIVFGSDDGSLYILNFNGNVVEKFKTQGSIESSPAISDVNSDGKKDIIFGSRDNRLYVITPPMNGHPLKIVGIYLTKGDIISSPSVGDLDNDGKKEIIFGSEDGEIYCLVYEEIRKEKRKYRNIGTGYWKNEGIVESKLNVKWSYKANREIVSSPAIGDLDNDGYLDVVIGSNDRNLYIFNHEGIRIYSYTTNSKIISSPVLVDLDKDKNLEIIFASSDGRIYILNSAGFRSWGHKISGRVTSSPVVVDLDDDGKLEIIITGKNKKLYVFGEKKEYVDMLPKLKENITETNTEKEENISDVEKIYEKKESNEENIKNLTESRLPSVSGFLMLGKGLNYQGLYHNIDFITLIILFGLVCIYISYRQGISRGIKEREMEDEKIIDLVLKERMRKKIKKIG